MHFYEFMMLLCLLYIYIYILSPHDIVIFYNNDSKLFIARWYKFFSFLFCYVDESKKKKSHLFLFFTLIICVIMN